MSVMYFTANIRFRNLLFVLILMMSQSVLAAMLAQKRPGYTLELLSEQKPALVVSLRARLQAHREYIEKSKVKETIKAIAEDEQRVLEKSARALGFYDVDVKAEYEVNAQGPIRYKIDAGEAYQLEKIEYRFPAILQQEKFTLKGLKIGDALNAEYVLLAEKDLLQQLGTHCLYELDLSYKVTLSREKKKATIVFNLADSPPSHFRTISFEGLEHTKEEFLRSQTSLKVGDCYSATRLNTERLKLLQTNLLNSVSPVVTHGNFVKPDIIDGRESYPIDITFQVAERKYRSIKAGAGYSTDEQAGISLEWQNRNSFGSGESMKVEWGLNGIRQHLDATYTIPHFYSEDRRLEVEALVEEEDTAAFESIKVELSATIIRSFWTNFLFMYGTQFAHSKVSEDDERENFNLVSAPVGLTWNKRDDLLNTTTGMTLSTSVAPFQDIHKEDLRFLRGTLAGTFFISASQLRTHPTLATRVTMGSMTGSSLDKIPADERFYSGGGGSIRGYAYQLAGELTDGLPNGGKSFGELVVESRFKLSPTWGLVAFVDGGYAYPEEMPSFGEDFLWGAGLGIRYFTGFAPIRFDVAVPLDKRENIDDDYQIYISIGQAF